MCGRCDADEDERGGGTGDSEDGEYDDVLDEDDEKYDSLLFDHGSRISIISFGFFPSYSVKYLLM